MLTRHSSSLNRRFLPQLREFLSGGRRRPGANGWHQGAALAATVAAVALTGCGANLQDTAAAGVIRGVKVAGHVHGGAYPIQGAAITLMESQSNGYGGVGKVLEQVTSDSNGYFTFDSKWTCDSGQYAYIVTAGGHSVPGSTTINNNVIQVGVIGACSTDLATASEIAGVNVFLSEPSTVAAAYALNNFIAISTDKTYGLLAEISAPTANNATASSCTGSGTMTCVAAGLAHGFTNAYNLVDSVRYDGSMPTGLARTAIPGNAQSVVPQAMINTLGNILQACVDSAGEVNSAKVTATTSDGSYCGTLFEYATPPSGTSPTNTLQVAQNIASYPNNNVDNLFKLQPRTTFFTPALTTDIVSNTTSTLISYSISIFYEGTGLTGDPGFGTPVHIALDAGDNAYVVYTGYDSVKKANYAAVDGLTAGGSGIFAGPLIYNVSAPNEVALDNLGYAWITDDSASGLLYQVSTSGTTAGAMKASFTVPNGFPGGVATDESNNVWISRDSTDSNQSLFQYLQAGAYALSPFQTCTTVFGKTTCTSATAPVLSAANKRLFIDSKQNAFGVTIGSSANAQFYVFGYGSLGAGATLTTKALSAASGFGIAMTSTDEAYLPLNGTLNSANATANGDTATITTNANSEGIYTGKSQTGSAFTNPGDAVIDGSGNIHWTDFESSGQLFKMVPGSDGKITDGTLTSVYPCFPLNNQCYGTSSNLRGMAIDSSGAIWYVAVVSPGIVVQTLGFAANSWPLLSYAHAAVAVQ